MKEFCINNIAGITDSLGLYKIDELIAGDGYIVSAEDVYLIIYTILKN